MLLLPLKCQPPCPPLLFPALPCYSQDALESIVEMREHDVPYHVRFEIDTDTRCGHWFTVRAKVGGWAGRLGICVTRSHGQGQG